MKVWKRIEFESVVFGDISWAHLISFLRVLGELVVVHNASLVLRGPVAHPHSSELLRALLGESGA